MPIYREPFASVECPYAHKEKESIVVPGANCRTGTGQTRPPRGSFIIINAEGFEHLDFELDFDLDESSIGTKIHQEVLLALQSVFMPMYKVLFGGTKCPHAQT